MRPVIVFILVIITTEATAQQGPQFTQFMFNNLALNPAYAGADEALSVTAVTRSQWTNVEGAPTTQSLAGHALVHDRVGLGLSVINDRIGVHRVTNFMSSYAYHIETGPQSFISFGLQGGFTNFKSDYLSLGVVNDPRSGVVRRTRLDLGAGTYFRSSKLDAGISVPGILSRKVFVSDTVAITFRNPDFLAYGRYRLKLNDWYVLQPAILIKYYPGVPLSYDVNGSIVYRNVITVGVSYRSSESLDALLKLQLTAKLELGYSYDYPLRSSSLPTGSSHEIMIHFVFKKDNRLIVSPR